MTDNHIDGNENETIRNEGEDFGENFGEDFDADVIEGEVVEVEASAPAETKLGEQTPVDTTGLQQQLSECQAKANEYLEGWQRSRAEFANYKKRVDRDQAQVHQNVTGSLIKRYLVVLDDMDRALRNRPQEGEGAAWANGIELIYRKLNNLLENEGVTAMDADGQMFDPNLHEAISSEPSDDHESGEIIEVVQKGYMLGERVLRPAVVRVAQ